ncbi:MAG: heavy-metal-associated domain-containing protein, partial [Clostridia bacterium]|nr:heavy-metal-associated domain-containing protein [Clostridia bacterium]
MHKVIKIANLDCAACAAELQEELEGIAGLTAVSVDFVGQRVSLDYEGAEAFQKAVYA